MATSSRQLALGAAVFLLFAVVFVVFPGTADARKGNKGKTPLLGWNTWCTQNSCGVDWCTSAEVLDVAQSIKSSGLQALGYDHINLDDCWGVRDNKTQQIMGDPTRFPEGMAAFIQKLHDMGFKFGLYTDIGPAGCHHPFTGSYGHYKDDAETFQSWKVDYVKFDGCDLPAGHTPKELTCNMSETLLNTGDDFWFNFHCWHDEACAQCGTSFRVGPDHHDNWDSTSGIIDLLQTRQPFWGPDPDYGWPDPDFVYPGGQGCGQHSDPGQRCPGQTEDEYITEFSIWAIAGGQIIFATDPRNMSALQKRILFNSEILNVFNDTTGFRSVKMVGSGTVALLGDDANCSLKSEISHATCSLGTSFGCFDNQTMWTKDGCRGKFMCDGVLTECNVDGNGTHICPCKGITYTTQVWARPTADGGAAVVLYNPGDSAVSMKVNFADIPDRQWSTSTTLKVRDLWAHEDNGTATGTYTAATVNSHGSVFLKLTTQ
eukprot:m.78263 g.78263  ORF g.78263 m.78263 type:complete len:487 (+) comp12664_c0_seq2:113-1573(+)